MSIPGIVLITVNSYNTVSYNSYNYTNSKKVHLNGSEIENKGKN